MAAGSTLTVSLDQDDRADIDACAAIAYHDSVRSAFARACRRAGTFEQGLEIGDVGVHLRFAGQGLPRVLLPALSPVLCSNCRRKDIEVELWDERTTGVGIPEPIWRLRDVIARGDVRSLSGGRIRAQVDSWNKILTLWDREPRRGIVWASDAHRLPYWVPAAPLRVILHWSLASRERHLLHAAAVGDERSGALLVGGAHSGKSTTALACLVDGLGYVGDDCVLAETEPSPHVVSVYGTAKLNASSVKLLPELPALRSVPDAPKFIVDVTRARPELMRRSAAVSVILLPQVIPGRLALRPANAAEALRALAPSTILQHADESATGMAVMATLVRQVPAYHLELGSDIAAVAPAIRDLLEASC
jgi:hypothetical protein